MPKYKDVDGDIIKLKLFPFSLRKKAKEWLLSLPRNSIDSWTKCKDAFIEKYYSPAKIISMRSDIMNFKQLEEEILGIRGHADVWKSKAKRATTGKEYLMGELRQLAEQLQCKFP
jgi:hypothetical protein